MSDRHRRIHEPRADGEITNIEEEDLENEEREFGDIREDSPHEEHQYLPGGITGTSSLSNGVNMSMMNGQSRMGMAAPSQLIQAQQQMLQGHM